MEEKKKEETQNIGLIDKADAAATRLETALKWQEELTARQEKLLAEQRLGGRSEAGLLPIVKKELTPQEYAKEVLAGRINPLL
jgi:hypothetical protein